jgi:hypothetical protein
MALQGRMTRGLKFPWHFRPQFSGTQGACRYPLHSLKLQWGFKFGFSPRRCGDNFMLHTGSPSREQIEHASNNGGQADYAADHSARYGACR